MGYVTHKLPCPKPPHLIYSPANKKTTNTVQRHVETTWHSLGTCSMAPREGNSIAKHGGVVDERLNVHGVKGLKVCDLSICPDNVGCNTFSVSLHFYTYSSSL